MTQLQSAANREFLDEDRLRNERVIGFMKRGVSGDAPGLTRIGTMQSGMLEKFEGLIDTFNLLLARKNEAWTIEKAGSVEAKGLSDTIKKLASPFEITMSYNALVKIYNTPGLGEAVRMKMRNDMMKLLPQLQTMKDNLYFAIIDETKRYLMKFDREAELMDELDSASAGTGEAVIGAMAGASLQTTAIYMEIYNILDFMITNIQSSSLQSINSGSLKINMSNVLASQDFMELVKLLKRLGEWDNFIITKSSDRLNVLMKDIFGDYLTDQRVREKDDEDNISDAYLPMPPPSSVPGTFSSPSYPPSLVAPSSASSIYSPPSSTAPGSSDSSSSTRPGSSAPGNSTLHPYSLPGSFSLPPSSRGSFNLGPGISMPYMSRPESVASFQRDIKAMDKIASRVESIEADGSKMGREIATMTEEGEFLTKDEIKKFEKEISDKIKSLNQNDRDLIQMSKDNLKLREEIAKFQQSIPATRERGTGPDEDLRTLEALDMENRRLRDQIKETEEYMKQIKKELPKSAKDDEDLAYVQRKKEELEKIKRAREERREKPESAAAATGAGKKWKLKY